MKVYRISKCQYIDDLSGAGAALYPGRWHSAGTHILYTAATSSLAMLETIVHIANIAVDETCMICLDLPPAPLKEIHLNNLPENWFRNPSPEILRLIGDELIKEGKYLALKVPSAIMPEESNYLLNPAHIAYKQIKKVYTRTIPIDERLFTMRR